MIWCILLVFVSLASARDVKKVDPAYLNALRAAGHDEEFAKLLGVDVSLVRSEDNEERSDGKAPFTNVSPMGDMLFLEESEEERQGTNWEKWGSYKWPNRQIPYTISDGDFSCSEMIRIENAIQEFNNKVKNLKLVKRTSEEDYVHVISGRGCWSYVGRIRGQQPLSVQRNGCLATGIIQHEFMHAAGFTHEHNRADRDNYVNVLWDNIPRSWHSQYYKVSEEDYNNLGCYEHYSVMHYPIWAPETYKDAFEILENGIDRDRIGQNDGITNMDVRKINQLYA